MALARIVELWDGVLYSVYNFFVLIFYTMKYFSLIHIIKRNKKLKNIHKGERCFIVLNGPSINRYDLKLLRNETVFCSNFMYKTSKVYDINPDYYCWLDSGIYKDREETKKVFNEIKSTCQNAKLILNIKGYKTLGVSDHIFYTYNKHLPNIFGVKGNMHGIFSGFQNVSLYIIMLAIYMGFENIYIAGLDFEPSGFSHFSEECGKTEDRKVYFNKNDVCGTFFQYLKAQYETFVVRKYGDKKNVNIYNLNKSSYVRAFEFSDFEEVLGKNT